MKKYILAFIFVILVIFFPIISISLGRVFETSNGENWAIAASCIIAMIFCAVFAVKQIDDIWNNKK